MLPAPNYITRPLSAMGLLLLVVLLRVLPAGATPHDEVLAPAVEAIAAPFTDSAILPQWLLPGGSTVPAAPEYPGSDNTSARTSLWPTSRARVIVRASHGTVANVATPPRYYLFCALLR